MGFGILVLDTGMVVGADAVGGMYDGSYIFNSQTHLLDVNVEVFIPAGISIVQGNPPAPQPYKFPINVAIARDLGKEQPIRVPTPFGNITVVYLRKYESSRISW